MQMVCDSMVYLGSDSTIHLYTQPICWNKNQQIAADSIIVYIVNGAVDHAVGAPNAICVMQDTLDIFNQMSGKEITAYLTDGEVHTIDVSGNALTIYYPRDEQDGSYVGMNTTESSFIRAYVKNRSIYRLRFTKETTGILFPLDQIPGGADRLTNFFWAAHVRPTSPEDVFRRADL